MCFQIQILLIAQNPLDWTPVLARRIEADVPVPTSRFRSLDGTELLDWNWMPDASDRQKEEGDR